MDLGERYCIICDRKNIESIQKLLFSLGYNWNGQSKPDLNYVLPSNTFYEKRIYISNYGSGCDGWILKDKFVYSPNFEDNDNVNIYTDLGLLRKEKLLKIKQNDN